MWCKASTPDPRSPTQNNSAEIADATTSPGRSEKTTRDVTFKAAKRGRSSCQTFEGLGVFQCVEIKCWTIQLLYGLKLPSFRCMDKIHGICNYILDCDLVCWSFLVHCWYLVHCFVSMPAGLPSGIFWKTALLSLHLISEVPPQT